MFTALSIVDLNISDCSSKEDRLYRRSNFNGSFNGLFKLFTVKTELQAGAQKDITYKILLLQSHKKIKLQHYSS